jgi:hypothetical protein
MSTSFESRLGYTPEEIVANASLNWHETEADQRATFTTEVQWAAYCHFVLEGLGRELLDSDYDAVTEAANGQIPMEIL